MNYELVTVIRPEDKNWNNTKNRLYESSSVLISILPDPLFLQKIKDERINAINIFNTLLNRHINEEASMFFNRAPVPYLSEIFMNEDFSISIINEGMEIGTIDLYPGTRRLVKNINYNLLNGKKDYSVEYTLDGKIYSELFYFNNDPQEMHFYNENNKIVVSYYFYQGKINYVVQIDPETDEVLNSFNSLNDFISDKLASFLTINDTVNITYMGMELSVLAKTKSKNSLTLVESPFDNNGNVRANLLHILTDEIKYIQEVVMSLEEKQQLLKKGIPTSKVIVKR